MLAIAVALIGALAVSAPVQSRDHVTWRAGDGVAYIAACSSLESISHVAMVVAGLEERRSQAPADCFHLPAPLPAVLEERVSNSFHHPGTQQSYSIWRVLDAVGDIEFTLIPDRGGPHTGSDRWQ